MLKRVMGTAQSLLMSRGYRIEWIGRSDQLVGPPRRDLGDSYALLRDLGVLPCTVIDVGAASGTPELMAAFPEAQLALFEPLDEFRGQLEGILAIRPGSLFLAAAGRQEGELTFYVHPDSLEGSSLLQETMGEFADGVARTVPVVRVDEAIRDAGLPGPYVLKIDVQGAELEALAGCTALLPQTLAICLEVSLFEFMKGAPLFAEVVAHMKSLGFVAWDIIGGWTRPLDHALGQIDIVFVPEAGSLRENHAFASAEQYAQMRVNS